MTLRHLTVFITVCKHNNFTRAAEELQIAQPAISATIAEIEKYYDVLLFERLNKKVILTAAGKTLLIKAKEVVAAFDDFENSATQSQASRILKIGASLTIGKTIIPGLVKKISTKFPELKVNVSINQTLDIERKISEGTLDLALIEGKVTLPRIRAEAFSKDSLIAVAGIGFDIKETIKLKELYKYPLLLREKGSSSRDFMDSVFSIQSHTAHPTVESISNEALISFAVENMGVAILPKSIVEDRLEKDLKKIEIEGINFERKYYLISHKDKRFSEIQEYIFESINTGK